MSIAKGQNSILLRSYHTMSKEENPNPLKQTTNIQAPLDSIYKIKSLPTTSYNDQITRRRLVNVFYPLKILFRNSSGQFFFCTRPGLSGQFGVLAILIRSFFFNALKRMIWAAINLSKQQVIPYNLSPIEGVWSPIKP
jgi:hypothetical protein